MSTETELTNKLQQVVLYQGQQVDQFTLLVGVQNVNRMLSNSGLVFPDPSLDDPSQQNPYEVRPELSMTMEEYRNLKPGDAWEPKNPYFDQDISVQDWPFEELPYMPAFYGAADEVDGQNYATFITQTADGQYDYVYMTHEQADAMLTEYKDNCQDFDSKRYRNFLSVCVSNSRQPDPNLDFNDPDFEAHLTTKFNAPVVHQTQEVRQADIQEPEVEVVAAAVQQEKQEAPAPEVREPPVVSSDSDDRPKSRPSDKRPPNPTRDFNVATRQGDAAFERVKALSAPEGDAPTQDEHKAAYRVAVAVVQRVPLMSAEQRAQLQQMFTDSGYEDMAQIVGQAVEKFQQNPSIYDGANNPDGYQYSEFSDVLTELQQDYIDPSELDDVNRAMLITDLQIMGHGRTNSFDDLDLTALDETQRGIFVERLQQALQNPEIYIPNLETGAPDPVFDDDANNSRHTYANMVSNVGVVVGDTTVKLADGQTYILCQTLGQGLDADGNRDIDMTFKTVEDLKADYNAHMAAIPEFDLSTDDGVKAAVEHMSVITSYGDAIRYIEEDIADYGATYDVSSMDAEDVKRTMPHVYAAMERLNGAASEDVLEPLEPRSTFKMQP